MFLTVVVNVANPQRKGMNLREIRVRKGSIQGSVKQQDHQWRTCRIHFCPEVLVILLHIMKAFYNPHQWEYS